MSSDRAKVLRTRREFLRQAACAAVGTAALTNTITDLRLLNSALAQTTSTAGDYKALVCLFLAGGNDANNLIVPIDSSTYSTYASGRSVLALSTTGTYPLRPLYTSATGTTLYADADGHNYGLHPAAAGLQSLFNSGKMAMMLNTGTLLYPITKSQYNLKSVAYPPQLFSHSDQVTQWQTSVPDQPPLSGWGGRCADLLNAVNTTNGGQISLAVSLAGANTLEIGGQHLFLFRLYLGCGLPGFAGR